MQVFSLIRYIYLVQNILSLLYHQIRYNYGQVLPVSHSTLSHSASKSHGNNSQTLTRLHPIYQLPSIHNYCSYSYVYMCELKISAATLIVFKFDIFLPVMQYYIIVCLVYTLVRQI